MGKWWDTHFGDDYDSSGREVASTTETRSGAIAEKRNPLPIGYYYKFVVDNPRVPDQRKLFLKWLGMNVENIDILKEVHHDQGVAKAVDNFLLEDFFSSYEGQVMASFLYNEDMANQSIGPNIDFDEYVFQVKSPVTWNGPGWPDRVAGPDDINAQTVDEAASAWMKVNAPKLAWGHIGLGLGAILTIALGASLVFQAPVIAANALMRRK